MSAGTDDAPAVAYRETLRTPWWWYVVAVGVAAIFAAEFHLPGLSLTDWIPWCTLLPLSVVLVWWLGRSRLEVRDGELRLFGKQRAHLPLDYITGAIALDESTMRRVVGREGDPAAFVSVRPWIGPGVQVWIDDEDDPTPYWLLSSRRAAELARAVRPTR